MTMVDNQYGFGMNIVPSGSEYDEHIMQIDDNFIHGESLSPDCPENGNGGYCYKFDKKGYMIGGGIRAGKGNHITSASKRPHHKIKGDATWGGKTILNRNKFTNFKYQTREGLNQYLFDLNPFGADHVPIVYALNTQFDNIDSDAFGHFFDPPTGWGNVKDCGNFPCTAPWNVLVDFKYSTYTGNYPN
jgi:hypothetical protein